MAEDPIMAQAFGVHYTREALYLSGLITATAGIAGFLVALKMPLYPALALAWLGTIVAAVIPGGLGNPIGALIATASLFVVQNVCAHAAQLGAFVCLLALCALPHRSAQRDMATLGGPTTFARPSRG